MFFNNHNHTPYSSALCGFKDAISTIESLIDRAVELNMKGLSITEHEGVSSHLNAINYVEKGKKDGSIPENFTLGLGNEIYLVSRNIVEEARENNGRIKFYHLILTAKDKIGHQAIRELSSMAWENSFNYRGILRRPTYKDDFVNCILKYQGHLICSTACLGSEYSELVLKYCEEETPQNKQAIVDYLNFMYKLFKDDFYIEIQPALNDEQEMYNKKAIQIAKACNIKVIITTDTHFTLAEDRLAHSIFLNSGDGDRETDLFYKYCYLQNIDEIYENLHYLPKEQVNEFLNNTLELANKIESYTLAGTPFVPDAHIPEYTPLNHFKDWYDKCPYIYKFASSTHDIDRYFLYLIEKGFIEKNRTFTEDYMARIEVELEQVWEISEYLQTRLSNYYCLVLEIIEEAWKTSLVGVGRGSSGCYEILFLADLTTISGYDYGLDWWRHICKERASSGLPKIKVSILGSINLVNCANRCA